MRKYPTIRKFKRYREVINILIKYGFGIIIERIHLFKFPFRKIRKSEYSIPVRIRKILEDLGPTFIKLGQILSTRPDLIPVEYIKELEKLQDEVKEENFELMREVIEKELKGKIEDIFEEFNSSAIASASLSCVYKGRYKGKDVAIKVQKPNVKEQILLDIQILYDIAGLIEKFIKESEIYQPVKIVKEFEKSIKKELNFLIEAKNIEIMKEKVKDDRLFIPEVFKDLCTEKILVVEYIEGFKINRVEEWSKYVDKEKILKNGTDILLKQIFDIGFFHGDPHPGNIFVLKDGRIALIDFGIVGKLDEEKKYYLVNLIIGILKGNTDKIIYTLKLMGCIDKNIKVDEFKEEIEDLVEVYKDVPLKNIKIGEIIESSFEIMRKNKIKLPISFTLMGKSIITLEGICNFVAPEFKFIESIEPFFIEFVEKKVKFRYYLKNLQNTIDRFYYILRELPDNLEYFIDTLKNRNENVDLENIKLQELNLNIKKTGIKISLSLVISSILISSVFLFLSDFFVYGISGFVITFTLLIFLFILIIKD